MDNKLLFIAIIATLLNGSGSLFAEVPEHVRGGVDPRRSEAEEAYKVFAKKFRLLNEKWCRWPEVHVELSRGELEVNADAKRKFDEGTRFLTRLEAVQDVVPMSGVIKDIAIGPSSGPNFAGLVNVPMDASETKLRTFFKSLPSERDFLAAKEKARAFAAEFAEKTGLRIDYEDLEPRVAVSALTKLTHIYEDPSIASKDLPGLLFPPTAKEIKLGDAFGQAKKGVAATTVSANASEEEMRQFFMKLPGGPKNIVTDIEQALKITTLPPLSRDVLVRTREDNIQLAKEYELKREFNRLLGSIEKKIGSPIDVTRGDNFQEFSDLLRRIVAVPDSKIAKRDRGHLTLEEDFWGSMKESDIVTRLAFKADTAAAALDSNSKAGKEISKLMCELEKDLEVNINFFGGRYLSANDALQALSTMKKLKDQGYKFEPAIKDVILQEPAKPGEDRAEYDTLAHVGVKFSSNITEDQLKGFMQGRP